MKHVFTVVLTNLPLDMMIDEIRSLVFQHTKIIPVDVVFDPPQDHSSIQTAKISYSSLNTAKEVVSVLIQSKIVFNDHPLSIQLLVPDSTDDLSTNDPEIHDVSSWSQLYSGNDGIAGYDFDDQTKMYFNSKLKYYYHLETGFYFHGILKYWMYFDLVTRKYIQYTDEMKEKIKSQVLEMQRRWNLNLKAQKDAPKEPIQKKLTLDDEKRMIQGMLDKKAAKKQKPKIEKNQQRMKQNQTMKLLNIDKKTANLIRSGEKLNIEEIKVVKETSKPIDEESNLGAKMMKQLGWKSGETLGKGEGGLKEPILVEMRQKGLGLGFSKESKGRGPKHRK